MFTMRLATEVETGGNRQGGNLAIAGDRSTNAGLTLRALPADMYQTMRIEPEVALSVERISSDGLDVRADRAMSPGRRVSLVFPTSPFLPRSGTMARVERCEREGQGWKVQLSYEALSVA